MPDQTGQDRSCSAKAGEDVREPKQAKGQQRVLLAEPRLPAQQRRGDALRTVERHRDKPKLNYHEHDQQEADHGSDGDARGAGEGDPRKQGASANGDDNPGKEHEEGGAERQSTRIAQRPLGRGVLAGPCATLPRQHASPQRALRYASALALGAALFMLLAGIVIAVGGSALFAGITFTSTAGITIRTVIGLLLIVLGVIQLGLIPVSFHGAEGITTPLLRRQARLRKEHPLLAFGLFGFTYVLAGFG